MSQVGLILNLVGGALWLAVTLALARRPPDLPQGATHSVRRMAWALLAVVTLGASTWGLPLGTTTAAERPPDPSAGPPTEAVSSFLRTPFALVERNVSVDAEGRAVRDQRRESLQVPVLLLLFLGAGLWLRRGARGASAGCRAASAAVALMVGAGLGACQSQGEGAVDDGLAALASVPRPERNVVEVAWDTLARVHSGVNDTVLFSAASPAADEQGFAVLDIYGSRIARFDWDGRLRGYIGRRGAGPGEFLEPRQLAFDGGGTLWVLDGGTARISGFDHDGDLIEELPLTGLTMSPSDFAVRHDGGAFRFMTNVDRLVPHVMDRTGAVTAGAPLDLAEGPQVTGMALQGLLTRTDTLDGWAFALGAGDGILPLRGLTWNGTRLRYPEAVPFPSQDRIKSRDGQNLTITTRLANPTYAAVSVDAWAGILYVVFMGSTSEAGRLLERWDLATGTYLDTMLLPKAGYIAVWEDRIVVAATSPEPEVLVLRARPATE